MEILGVEHTIESNKVVINPDNAHALLNTLLEPLQYEEDLLTLDAINKVSPVEIIAKAPTDLGGRVGRPEKTKERMMKPAPHALFP